MKKITYFLMLATPLLFAFTSCKKKNKKENAPASTISASVNGTATDFSINAKAIKTSININGVPMHQILVVGTASNGTAISLAFYIEPIAGRTYTEENGDINLILQQLNQNALDSFGSTNNPVSITVSAIDNTSITGTFKGDIGALNPDGNNPLPAETKAITNGKFKVAF